MHQISRGFLWSFIRFTSVAGPEELESGDKHEIH
jgi:hypothetical protein